MKYIKAKGFNIQPHKDKLTFHTYTLDPNVLYPIKAEKGLRDNDVKLYISDNEFLYLNRDKDQIEIIEKDTVVLEYLICFNDSCSYFDYPLDPQKLLDVFNKEQIPHLKFELKATVK